MHTPPRTPAPPPTRLVFATAAAALIAAIVLVVAVLPVEYGIDYLGAGRALGLVRAPEPVVAAPADAPAPSTASNLAPSPVAPGSPVQYFDAPYATDTKTFQLGPYDYVEYKYRLERGASVTFSWRASATVTQELHADPDGADGHNPVSFDKRDIANASGTHVAPFSGMHGWYWENLGGAPVTVTITSAGFYSSAMEYRPNKRQVAHTVTQGATRP